MKTKRSLIVLVLFAALLLVGCGAKNTPAPVVPVGAQAGELVDLQPCTYKAGDIEYSADCGTLVVPENRSDPNSRLIALPVIRVRALNKSQAEPIMFLTGGPGRSNLHFKYLAGLVDNYDFVQVGYRGVDGSSVLDCPETVNVLKSAGDMLSKTALDNFAASIAQCAKRLQSEGVDIAGYTLLESVKDMEAARVALGYEKINLLSESVGTRTGIIYGQAYPESIHRSVMVGVNPPGHFLWKAEVTDEQLKYYSELCAQDAVCSSRTDNLAETMREVSHNMPKRWLFMTIEPGTVKLGSFLGMFHTSTAPFAAPWIIDAWLSASEGDPSGLALLSFASHAIFPSSFVWGETAAMGASADLPDALQYLAETNPEDSIIGMPASTWMWGGMSSWPADLMPEEFRQVQPSDVETLLIGGNVDFSTPSQFARDEVLPHLSKGQQVILLGFGHTDDVWGLQPEATAHLIDNFFSTGVVDDSLFTAQPISFEPRMSLPVMAKLLVAAMVILPALVILGVVLVVRLIRKRSRKSGK